VAVIDQGFDISHPDLANKTLSTTDPRTGNPYGYTTEYHGTFCASSAGAETDGGGPLASVGFNTMLWLYDYDISAADIAYHASFDKGADVISFSWGGLTSATTREKLLVQEVLDNGTVIVRSAGNSQSDSDNNRFPFAYQVDSRIIIVSGTDKNDNHTNPAGGPPYANYPQVSVCSPGYSVMGAIRFDSGATTYPYQVGGGTSYATPIVAGVCALLKSVNKNLTPEEIKNIIQTTVDPIADANMYPGLLGTGRVNAYKAVQKAVCTTVPPVYFTNQTVTTDTTVTSDCDINVQNVTVTNGATLTLEAAGRVNIISGFEVELGSKFEIKK
jgi:subtilisin family serine protease